MDNYDFDIESSVLRNALVNGYYYLDDDGKLHHTRGKVYFFYDNYFGWRMMEENHNQSYVSIDDYGVTWSVKSGDLKK